MEKSTKDQAQLLADARQARKDALDSILELIPEEQEPQFTPVFPKATHLLAPALAVARRHTDEALRNIHTQLVDLGKEHIPQEQAGAFFNTTPDLVILEDDDSTPLPGKAKGRERRPVPRLWVKKKPLRHCPII